MTVVATTPFGDQVSGTSGLRKKCRYLSSSTTWKIMFNRSLTLWNLIIGSDSRFYITGVMGSSSEHISSSSIALGWVLL